MGNKKDFKVIIEKAINEDISSVLLLLWLSELFFMTVARFVLARLGFYDGIVRTVILLMVSSIALIAFLVSIPKLKKNQYDSFCYLFLGVVLIIILTALIHPENNHFLTRKVYGLERVLRPDCAIYAYLFFGLIDNPKKLMNVVKKFAILDFAYLIIVELLPTLYKGYWEDINYLGEKVQRGYSLSFGYAMLLPVLVGLYVFIKEKNWKYLIMSAIGGTAVFIHGSRGALLIIAVFVGLMIINDIIESKDTSKKIIKISCIVAIVLFACIFGKVILGWLNGCLQTFGIESRNLEMLVSGNFTNDSGRSVIWKTVIDAIKAGGLFGYGFYGDRPFVSPHHYAGYSHNIFLELLVSFGIIGLVIIVVLIVSSIRMIFMCKDREWRELFIIFFSISCQLLMSMSFWYVMEFWAAIAIAHNYFRLEKKAKQK